MDADRGLIATSVESLLARPYHTPFLQGRRTTTSGCTANPVKDFLSILNQFDPIPYMDPDLLMHLAEHYNAWHEVINHLDGQYLALRDEETGDRSLSALRHCYKKLGENSIWMSLAVESCKFPFTKHAISLDLYGYLNEATEAYADLVSKVEAKSAQPEPSDYEMDLWEERWVRIQRERCQLAVVTEYANASLDHGLQLECAWKNQEWSKLRELISSEKVLPSVEKGDALVKMSETLLAVADGKLTDVENLHAQTAQLCLYQWQLLPPISSGSPSHASLLHFFHRLVEVRESGQIMVETASHSSGRTLPDLKNLLGAWRHRLPNDWEPISQWDEIFAWRSQMFRATTKNFQWAGPSALSTLHDAPWSSVRLAKSARKQGFREVASLLLSQADEREVNVSDAYLKLREQILTYYNNASDLERHGGLNLVNTTNFDFFNVSQKSELFRLKASFLASLGGRSKANQAYCHSLLISPENARAWVSWGELCASLGAVTEEQIEKAGTTGSEGDRDALALATKKVPQYLTQAMGCFLEAIRIDASEWSRLYLPKCLWMLTKDSTNPPVIGPRFENRGLMLPPWVWYVYILVLIIFGYSMLTGFIYYIHRLPWLPQLLTCFYRPEGRSIKRIFSAIVKAYPQAAYYTLRSFYLERRDVERASGTSSSSSSHMPSVACAEEMMSLLRRSHPCLWSSLEAILEELIVKFRPSTEEEFLATIVALLERAESQTGSVTQTEQQNLASSIQKTLSKIAFKYFRNSESSQKSDERAKRTAEFKATYRDSFESDFHVSADDASEQGPTKVLSLEEIFVKIRNWKHKLQRQVLVLQPRINLVEASQSLAIFGMGDAPDLWPGSCDPRDGSPPLTTPELGFEADGTGPVSSASSASAARNAANGAAAAASSLAHREGVGGEYGGGSSCIEIPGQYMPNSYWADTRPSPELHIKIVRFEPTVEVVRRSDQLVRRIGILGSDGKNYAFLLQCALSYWTRTDERSSQIHFVVEKFLRRSVLSARANLSVQPNSVIPIAQRLRLVEEQESRTSLQEEYESFCVRNNRDPEEAVIAYNEEQRKSALDHASEVDGDDHARNTRSLRAEVYQKTKERYKDHRYILARQICATLEGPESFFYFRKMFAQQWAADCLFQYAFAVAERNPSRVVIIQSNGRVLSPDSRIVSQPSSVCRYVSEYIINSSFIVFVALQTYNTQGYLESKILPFRISPNIKQLIGFPLLSGHFLPSIAKAALAVNENKELVSPILNLLLRDDLTSFYTKSIAKSDNKTQEMERQLMDRIVMNSSTVLKRFAECSPSFEDANADKSVDEKLKGLIAEAQDPTNVCMMQGSYQGWL
jgi:transformation/transcription domain-associated protein